jgi:hypothetical protein
VSVAVLYDTDVLVDFLRGRGEARDALEAEARDAGVSTLVVAELYAGVRDGAERQALEALLGLFEAVPLEADDAVQGGLWRRTFGPSHGTGIVDALIAAQAFRLGAEVVTLNARHFPMLGADGVRVPYRKA